VEHPEPDWPAAAAASEAAVGLFGLLRQRLTNRQLSSSLAKFFNPGRSLQKWPRKGQA
jgi:hypothetical protein